MDGESLSVNGFGFGFGFVTFCCVDLSFDAGLEPQTSASTTLPRKIPGTAYIANCVSLKLGDAIPPPPLQEPWYFYLANCAINLNTALPLFLLLPFLSLIPRRIQPPKPKTAPMLLILSPAYLWVTFRKSLALSPSRSYMSSPVVFSSSDHLFCVFVCRLLLRSGYTSCPIMCEAIYGVGCTKTRPFPPFSIAPTAQGGALPLHRVPANAHICGGLLR
jgi:hypothetical protein